MEACEGWVRSRRVPKIQLIVRTTNQSTVGFYEHLGYAASARCPSALAARVVRPAAGMGGPHETG